jgi:hypothetical protein
MSLVLLQCLLGLRLLMQPDAAVVPVGLAPPLLAQQLSGGAKRKRTASLPQTFLFVSSGRDQIQVHGLFTLDAVCVFGRGASLAEQAQLAAMRLDPSAAVIWSISASTTVTPSKPLLAEHCVNLTFLNVAKLSPEGVAWLFDQVDPGQLPCHVSRVRCWRVPARALKPTVGMQTVVTPVTFCRSSGIDKPIAEVLQESQPEEQGAMVVADAGAAANPAAGSQWAVNAAPLHRGWSEYEFTCSSVFLGLRLMHRLRTCSCNGSVVCISLEYVSQVILGLWGNM